MNNIEPVIKITNKSNRHRRSQRQTGSRTLLAAIIGLASVSAQAEALNGDGLLNLLEKKGLLSQEEAHQLRQEADQNFHQNFDKSFQAKTGLPDWVNSLKFNGDFRGRFEVNSADNSSYIDRDRFRYRLRLGATASMVENFDVGFRLSSGNPQTNPGGTLVGGQSITANQDMNSLESRKFIWIDLAYGKWTPITNSTWTVSGTFGKMENPFLLSNMIWDYDIRKAGPCKRPIVLTTTSPSRPMERFLSWMKSTRHPRAPGPPG